MYNNSYVNQQFGLKVNVQLKSGFSTTLEVASHGITNNMESSGAMIRENRQLVTDEPIEFQK